MLENEQEVESTQEISAPESDAGATEQLGQKTVEQQLVDLDSVGKFRYGGKEYTPKSFQGAYVPKSEYTKKTQAYAEERKFYDNLRYDLASVKTDPSLIERFKQIYPEKYHSYLDFVSNSMNQQNQQQSQQFQNQPAADPRYLARLEQVERKFHDQEVRSAETEIQNRFNVLSKKFPMADEEAVLARAQIMAEKGEELDDKSWESLWKMVHDKNQKLADQHYSKKVTNQKQLNQKGKDAGAGGGTPGAAPKMPKTIKEASRFALQEMEQS